MASPLLASLAERALEYGVVAVLSSAGALVTMRVRLASHARELRALQRTNRVLVTMLLHIAQHVGADSARAVIPPDLFAQLVEREGV